MADKMTPEQRHRCMSRIRGRDTKPEMTVRRWLWHQGFRYRLCVKALPGCPDIVMRKWHTVIMVNGCFWHGHGCQKHKPATNARFWHEKIARNQARDKRNQAMLRAAGWNVIVVWECQLTPKRRQATLRDLDLALSRIVLQHSARPAGYASPPALEPLTAAAEPAADYGPKPDTNRKSRRSTAK